MTGEQPRLIIVRGPSGAGKSTLAAKLRERLGAGTALISQDRIRREMIGEYDRADSITPGLMVDIAEHLLRRNFDVIIEGMLRTANYLSVVNYLTSSSWFDSYLYRLDVDLSTAHVRHDQRRWSARVAADDFEEWFRDYTIDPHIPGEVEVDALDSPDIVAQLVMSQIGPRRRPPPPNSRAVEE